MSQAEKALSAIREYDRLMTAISENTSDISDGLSKCTRAVLELDIYGELTIPIIQEGVNTHLSEAFEHDTQPADSGWGNERIYMDECEQLELIGECEGCKKAYAAIIERKANKKSLGIIKRSMRMIGRAKRKEGK